MQTTSKTLKRFRSDAKFRWDNEIVQADTVEISIVEINNAPPTMMISIKCLDGVTRNTLVGMKVSA